MIGYKYFLAIPGRGFAAERGSLLRRCKGMAKNFSFVFRQIYRKKNVSFCFLCYLDLSFHFRKKSLPSGMMAVRPMRMHDRK
jgi:hypothetical protein